MSKQTTRQPSSQNFLAAGGETGRLLRAHDWTGSALAAPAFW